MSEPTDSVERLCPICELKNSQIKKHPKDDIDTVHCANCGTYEVAGSAWPGLPGKLGEDKVHQATVSYYIRKRQGSKESPCLDTTSVDTILTNVSLPRVAEKANLLILSIGDNLEHQGCGTYLPVDSSTYRAEVGAVDTAEVGYVLSSLEKQEIIEGSDEGGFGEPPEYRLTFRGWERYEELRRTTKDSRKAFMAMEFGDPELNDFFEDHFKPAVKATGFDLQKLDDEPKAGIIDVRMEVEIRNARFVVADLSHGNNGVYWEAGFASGLDKPVIYTCKAEKAPEIHFDTNHRHFVKWDPANPSEAETMLKATIRATLPTEARWEDA
jgi:nucleoside 2-deoxyribosyltransferase